MIADFN